MKSTLVRLCLNVICPYKVRVVIPFSITEKTVSLLHEKHIAFN